MNMFRREPENEPVPRAFPSPVVTAAGTLLAAAALTRSPLRWVFAAAAGFVAGQALRSQPAPSFGSWGGPRARRRHKDFHEKPQWVSDPQPETHTGTLSDDTLVHASSQDSFPASDPPSYTHGRGDHQNKDDE